MRLFHALILDEFMEGNPGAVKISHWWGLLLARAEALKFTFLVDTVSGTSPTLDAVIYGGWADENNLETVKSLLSSESLSSGTNTFSSAYSPLDTNYPLPRWVYVQAGLGGTDPKAHVKIWVCGRGPQLLEALPPQNASFHAQYAAAKRIEDEDRMSVKKEVLAPGASLFYPPEIFLSSLTWER